jgi:putative flippase GtrA
LEKVVAAKYGIEQTVPDARGMPGKLFRFLLIGGVNTAFGYSVSMCLYYALRPHVHLVVISVIANAICITEAFLAHKVFVFRSRASWMREYLRCYVVYGGSMLIGIAGLWLLVEMLGTPFWIAQALLTIVGMVVSFTGHDRFTFKKMRVGK